MTYEIIALLLVLPSHLLKFVVCSKQFINLLQLFKDCILIEGDVSSYVNLVTDCAQNLKCFCWWIIWNWGDHKILWMWAACFLSYNSFLQLTTLKHVPVFTWASHSLNYSAKYAWLVQDGMPVESRNWWPMLVLPQLTQVQSLISYFWINGLFRKWFSTWWISASLYPPESIVYLTEAIIPPGNIHVEIGGPCWTCTSILRVRIWNTCSYTKGLTKLELEERFELSLGFLLRAYKARALDHSAIPTLKYSPSLLLSVWALPQFRHSFLFIT